MKSFDQPSRALFNKANALQRVSQPTKTIVDNRPIAVKQRKLQETANSKLLQTLQPKVSPPAFAKTHIFTPNFNTFPIQRLSIPGQEKIKRDVVNLGYNFVELEQAIRDEQLRETSSPIGAKEFKRVYEEIKEECYSRVYRIQDELAHNTPRAGYDDIDQGDGSGAYLWGDIKDKTYDLGLIGNFAASHTYGLKDTSSFVSLCQDHSKLAKSADKGEGTENVSNVLDNAKYLCEYMVPNEFLWTPDQIVDRINSSDDWRDVPVSGGDYTSPQEWLEGTPTKETEVLYYGWDLNKYLTNHVGNPYKVSFKNKRGKAAMV